VTVSVVLADDQGLVRSGLRFLLEQGGDVEVVGEAADGEQALAAVRRLHPDVVVMDIRMPNLDGLAATRTITRDRTPTRVLILTTYDLDEYVFEALRAGASGFMLKDAPARDLTDAVKLIAAGDALLAPAVTRRVIEAFAGLPTPSAAQAKLVAELTGREREVLRLLARGLSNAEIANKLVISSATVKTHVSSVLMKLNLRDRIQAVIFAYDSGLAESKQQQT
jgi:DNA-binding NarL/FixJ family response regulator